MVLILLSWIYIFFTSLNFGILFKKIVRIKDCHIIIQYILGLFLYTIFISIVAFFIRINIEIYVAVFILNCIIFLTNRNTFSGNIRFFFNSIKKLKLVYKILLISIFIITLAQSATKPYLLDNESYYIQTIKWVNEFGYIKGLANLHMFLAQNSSWHTLQAGFNFPFIPSLFNDLNGYLYVLISVLAIEKINNYKNKLDEQDFCFGLILLFTLFFMQFINAPSPDVPIFILTPYIFYLFIKNFKTIESDDFKIILSLTLFLCFIKVTIAPVALLSIILFIKHYKELKKALTTYVVLCGVILILFLFKNSIISGYLLFPSSAFDYLNVDWKLSEILMPFYTENTYLAGFDYVDISQLNNFESFWFWLNASKLNGIFNKFFVLLLVVFPWFIYKKKNATPLTIIYLIAVLQFFILWNKSPQYRFFFVFIIFISIQILVTVIKKKNSINYLLYFSVLTSAIPIFFEINLNTFTTNSFALKLSVFKTKNILIPESISKTNSVYTKEVTNGFEFYSPSDDTFFWATGNGKLPCVNKKQIESLKYYYQVTPQLRTSEIKDGFKSVKTSE